MSDIPGGKTRIGSRSDSTKFIPRLAPTDSRNTSNVGREAVPAVRAHAARIHVASELAFVSNSARLISFSYRARAACRFSGCVGVLVAVPGIPDVWTWVVVGLVDRGPIIRRVAVSRIGWIRWVIPSRTSPGAHSITRKPAQGCTCEES